MQAIKHSLNVQAQSTDDSANVGGPVSTGKSRFLQEFEEAAASLSVSPSSTLPISPVSSLLPPKVKPGSPPSFPNGDKTCFVYTLRVELWSYLNGFKVKTQQGRLQAMMYGRLAIFLRLVTG